MGVSGLNAQFLISGDVYRRTLVEQLLDALEKADALRPTHWGAAMGLRDPYDRSAIIRAVEERGDGGIVPQLMRTRGPGRFAAQWYPSTRWALGAFHLETRGALAPGEAAALCEALSSVADALPLEWGHIDLRFEGQDRATWMLPRGSWIHPDYHAEFGLTCLFPRTFFGPRLVRLMEDGGTPVEGLGLPVRRLASGVVELDLVPEPWTSDAMTLKKRQQDGQRLLVPGGLFIQPSSSALPVRAARWQPPPAEEHESLSNR